MMSVTEFKALYSLTDEQFKRACKKAKETTGCSVKQRVGAVWHVTHPVEILAARATTRATHPEILEAELEPDEPSVGLVPVTLKPAAYALELRDFQPVVPAYDCSDLATLAAKAQAHIKAMGEAELEALKAEAIEEGRQRAHIRHQFSTAAEAHELQQLRGNGGMGKQ
jgi:hypothetical protein